MPPTLTRFEADLHPPRRLVVRYRPSRTQIRDVLAAVQAAGVVIADLTTEEADLEDIFIALTQADDNGGA